MVFVLTSSQRPVLRFKQALEAEMAVPATLEVHLAPLLAVHRQLSPLF
jgi:Na+/H+ antiporter NhaB